MALIGFDCDIIFLSYAEPGAEANFRSLLTRYPRTKRLHGVTGMGRAYKMTAEITDSEYYFIIDADNEILDSFDLNSISIFDQSNIIRVWSAKNAVNGLVYGYGGLKLCSREGMRTLQDNTLDVLGSGQNKLIFESQIAGVTCFNTSPYDAWKAGFRECCMLQAGSGIHMSKEKSLMKLKIWKTKGEDKPFGLWAVRGAHEGASYAFQHAHDFIALKKIDDPRWLQKEFLTRYPNQEKR